MRLVDRAKLIGLQQQGDGRAVLLEALEQQAAALTLDPDTARSAAARAQRS